MREKKTTHCQFHFAPLCAFSFLTTPAHEFPQRKWELGERIRSLYSICVTASRASILPVERQ